MSLFKRHHFLHAALMSLLLGLPVMAAAGPGLPGASSKWAKYNPMSVNWKHVFDTAGQMSGFRLPYWPYLLSDTGCTYRLCGFGQINAIFEIP